MRLTCVRYCLKPMRDKHASSLLIQQSAVDIAHDIRFRVRIERRRLQSISKVWKEAGDMLTASSKKRMGESFRSNLATASLCFSPPLIMLHDRSELLVTILNNRCAYRPRSPTLVCHLSGNDSMVRSALAFRAASLTSSSIASIRP